MSVHILDPASLDVLIQKLETHPGGCVLLRKIADFGVRLVCVPAEALPVSRCGNLGRSLHLSELQFSHLQEGLIIPVTSPLHWSPLKFWHSARTCLCQVFSLFECLSSSPGWRHLVGRGLYCSYPSQFPGLSSVCQAHRRYSANICEMNQTSLYP